MSDSAPPPEAHREPHERRATGVPAAPSAVVQHPVPFEGQEGASSDTAADLARMRYSRTGTTPLPMMVVAGASIAAAAWAVHWSRPTIDATDPVRTSEWWTNVTAVLLPGETLRVASYSQFRMWVAIGLLVVAALVLCLWIGRIGHNLRLVQEPFGSLLPLIALPAWWLLPLTLGTTNNFERSTADLALRYMVGFGILFAQFLLVRWPLLNRIWRAGRLPYDLGSILLWLPMMIPWSLLFVANVWRYFYIDDGVRQAADSPLRPTPAMLDWARSLTRASGIGLLVLLVVVSIAQHIGMRKDRVEDEAQRRAHGPLAT